MVRLTAWVTGRVQGVGFRWWVRSRALELGLSGYAANLADGRVEVLAEGPREACEALLAALQPQSRQSRGPGEVASVAHVLGVASGTYVGFLER